MAATCTHLDTVNDVAPSSEGCEDCLRIGDSWLHLRMCQECGHIGCCDNSPNRHATAHFHEDQHPLIRSYEPGEDWWWCYVDELAFEVPGAPPAPSHP
jgi:Zn-finger in ubiquitin-hydrolases and other protein